MHELYTNNTNTALTVEDVCRKLSISRTTLHRIRTDPYSCFPKPIAYTGKRLWLAKMVDEWLVQEAAKNNGGSKNTELNKSLASLEDKP